MEKVWTQKMDRLLKQEFPTADLYQLAEMLGVTKGAVKSRAQKLHLQRAVNVKHIWTPEEDAVLRERYAESDTHELARQLGTSYNSTYQRANKLGLYKTHEFLSRTSSGPQNGMSSRFKKGVTPFNKGMKEWQFRSKESIAKCAATQFKPGQTPHNIYPIGFESVHADGYTWVKLAEGMVQKHVYLWQQHNGPIPEGMMVVFRDGDKSNFDIDNLQLMNRANALREINAKRTPERQQEIIEQRNATRNETIRKDYLRIRWGLEPKTKLVKRWHDPISK